MRCAFKDCNKSVPLSFQFSCKCGLMYCRGHFNDHGCEYDYKREQKDKLEKEHPKIVVDKINKI